MLQGLDDSHSIDQNVFSHALTVLHVFVTSPFLRRLARSRAPARVRPDGRPCKYQHGAQGCSR